MTDVKRIIFILLLCTVLTGCADDYYDEPEIQTETAEETMPETGETSNEAAESYSDLIFSETAAIPEITEIQETVTVSEENELITYEYEEEQEPEIIEIPEETAPEPTEIVMTEEPTETKLMTETETVPETTEIPETEPISETEATEHVTEILTESETEPELSDFEKAQEVYAYMLENGHGTCVNHACQTYEKCFEIGLPCYIVWTDAGLYGHTANAVCIDGIWFIMDTQAGGFLESNYGFTEVVNMDCEHIADGDMLSDYSYQELFQ